MDDYCLQNRNFLRVDAGFLKCLSLLKILPQGCWLANQHVGPMFRFSRSQLERMQSALEERIGLLRALVSMGRPELRAG
jgi:hypothetical protein